MIFIDVNVANLLNGFLLQYFICLLIVFAAEIAAAVFAHVNLDKVIQYSDRAPVTVPTSVPELAALTLY